MEAKTYLDAEGNTVFTSAYLKARGSCCKTGCLHCPYGHTLKKLGLQFEDWHADKAELAKGILEEAGQGSVDLTPFLPDNVKFILIKGRVCGLLTKNHIVVKGLYLRQHFTAQGLSKEMVESYYFA